MSVYQNIRQLVVQEFFPKRFDFPGIRQNWIWFVFTVLPKHINIAFTAKVKLSSKWLRTCDGESFCRVPTRNF